MLVQKDYFSVLNQIFWAIKMLGIENIHAGHEEIKNTTRNYSIWRKLQKNDFSHYVVLKCTATEAINGFLMHLADATDSAQTCMVMPCHDIFFVRE